MILVAVQEVGRRAESRLLAIGQIEGGVAQGIGWALYEKSSVGRRADAEQSDDELYYSHLAGHSADSRVL